MSLQLLFLPVIIRCKADQNKVRMFALKIS